MCVFESKRTLCLLGSPRRGSNSEFLAERFLQAKPKTAGLVTTIALSDLSYSGCQNFFECKNSSERCGLSDDLTKVLLEIEQAEVLVLASPVYFTNVTAQTKAVIDRLFSFFVPGYANIKEKSRLSGGRTLVWIQTQGEGEEMYADLMKSYETAFRGLGFEHFHLIRAWGVREPGDVLANPEFLQSCDSIAEKIYSNR
jgi:multimeric flavodoxin WrbA